MLVLRFRWGLAVALFVAVSVVRAEAPKTDTPEQQIVYLEDALSEGFRTQDWKMTEMAISGLKAVNVSGPNAEISVLKAEREAAFDSFNTQRAQIETWGLIARYKLGDTNALSKLRERASNDVVEVKPPDGNLFRTKPAEFKSAQKAYTEYVKSLQRKDAALLGLALLKEPGVLDRALTALRGKKANANQNGMIFYGGMQGTSDPLVEAALLADPQAGFKGLLALCDPADDKVAPQVHSMVLQALIRMAYPPKFQNPDAPFTLEGDIEATLPKDSAAELVKPYIAQIKAWQPDPKVQWDQDFFGLISAGATFPAKTINEDGIAALKDLKTRVKGQMAQWSGQYVDQVLKAQGVEIAARANNNAGGASEKPPKPPGDF